ncbi:MAG TPA: hypothetical protein VEU33_15560 [Archangium sp.]|nr:hypothetical protein [Archangium sp.]
MSVTSAGCVASWSTLAPLTTLAISDSLAPQRSAAVRGEVLMQQLIVSKQVSCAS